MEERKFQKNVMQGLELYIQEPSPEWEAVERWENEGGRLRPRYDQTSIEADKRPHAGRVARMNESVYTSLRVPDNANYLR